MDVVANLIDAVVEYAVSCSWDDARAIDLLVEMGLDWPDFEEAGFGDFARAYFLGDGER